MIQIIILIVIVGVLLWLINTYVPMQQPIKTILNIFVCIVLVLWLLNMFGLFSGLPAPHRILR